MNKHPQFDNHLRNAYPPALLVVVFMLMVYWADFLFMTDFHKYGVLPRSIEGLKGVIFMPWIHAHDDYKHLLNNSIPTFLLITLLFYSYKKIALKVFFFSWIYTGVFLWIFAKNNGAYHIGMSGVIYSLATFLFTSGVLRKYLPLQALSLFIVFIYGSLIWGIFPTNSRISWEGHLMGFVVGIILAFYYRKEGPQRPKYDYEIEKELGIEPPDLEGIYLEQQRIANEQEQALDKDSGEEQRIKILYDYKKDLDK